MYLLELRVRLLEKMLTDFIDGVDIFLSLHRDADAATLNKLQVGRWITHCDSATLRPMAHMPENWHRKSAAEIWLQFLTRLLCKFGTGFICYCTSFI